MEKPFISLFMKPLKNGKWPPYFSVLFLVHTGHKCPLVLETYIELVLLYVVSKTYVKYASDRWKFHQLRNTFHKYKRPKSSQYSLALGSMEDILWALLFEDKAVQTYIMKNGVGHSLSLKNCMISLSLKSEPVYVNLEYLIGKIVVH